VTGPTVGESSFLVVIFLVTIVGMQSSSQEGSRRIPIVSAKPPGGGQVSLLAHARAYLPLKLNAGGGDADSIFASSGVFLPLTVAT